MRKLISSNQLACAFKLNSNSLILKQINFRFCLDVHNIRCYLVFVIENNNKQESENEMENTMTASRPLTEKERFLLNHITMFGIDGAPIAKMGRKWMLSYPEETVMFATKREALEAFDRYFEMLLDLNRHEAAAAVAAERAADVAEMHARRARFDARHKAQFGF